WSWSLPAAAKAAVCAGTDRATRASALGGGLPNIALPILFRAGDGGGALAAGRVRHAVEDRIAPLATNAGHYDVTDAVDVRRVARERVTGTLAVELELQGAS